MQWLRTVRDIKWYQYIWGGRYNDELVDEKAIKGIDVCLLWCSSLSQPSASGASIGGHTPGCIRTVVQLVWTSGSHQWHQKVRHTTGESRVMDSWLCSQLRVIIVIRTFTRLYQYVPFVKYTVIPSFRNSVEARSLPSLQNQSQHAAMELPQTHRNAWKIQQMHV